MVLPFDPPAAAPLYRQVKEILVARIAKGDWRPGDMLPSEPKLAAELGVSPGTVRKALDEMTSDKLVQRRQGRGTFVATTTSDSALFHFFKLVDDDRRPMMPESRELSRLIRIATADERRVLKLGPKERVVFVRRLRASRGVPMMVETVTLPLRRFPEMERYAEEFPNTLYDLYQFRFNVTIRQVAEVLRAVTASEEDSELLKVAAGAPLLEIDREAFTFDHEPVEWRVSRLDTRHTAYLSVID